VTPKELREKTLQELKTLEQSLREELFKLNLQNAMGQLEKTHRLKELKRDIARVLTLLKEKAGKAA
jgi:large subunit ribosomal protein L29